METLEYSTRPTQNDRRRRLGRRLVAVAVVLLVAIVSLYHYRAEVNAAYDVWHLKRQWSTHLRPADTQVFAEPDEFASTLARGVYSYKELLGNTIRDVPNYRVAWAFTKPHPPIIHQPGFSNCVIYPSPGPVHGRSVVDSGERIIFMHHRTSAGGADRLLLVVVEGHGRDTSLGKGRTLVFRYAVVDPGKTFDTGSFVYGSDFVPGAIGGPGADAFAVAFPKAFKIYAGQPDADDESRFSFRYEYGGEGGTVHGHLRADDHIDFSASSGPLQAAMNGNGGKTFNSD